MTTRHGHALLLAMFACTPISRPPVAREANEEPAAVAMPRVMTRLPASASRLRPLAPDFDGLGRAKGRKHLAETEWGEPRPGDPLFACQRDDDCSIVQLDTCDETNGGWILSVRKDRLHEARYRWQTDDTSEWCTLLGSLTEAYPRCGAGTCMRGYRPTAHARRVREELSPRGGKAFAFRTMVPNHVPPQ